MEIPVFLSAGLGKEIEQNARSKKIKKDEVLIRPGDDVLFVPIVLKDSAASVTFVTLKARGLY